MGSAVMCAIPGSKRPAKEINRPVTNKDVTVESDLKLWVPTKATHASAQAMEMAFEETIPCAIADPTPPILTVLKAMTKAFTKTEQPAMALAAVFELRFTSAKSLKELGTSFPEALC